MESREDVYANLDAAIKAGEVARGWLPAFLPKSSAEIRIRSDVENNQVWVSFRIDASDISVLAGACKQASWSEVLLPKELPSDWWPDWLVQNYGDLDRRNKEYELYQCKNGRLVIDTKERDAFYWNQS